jgi:hypothetical protein
MSIQIQPRTLQIQANGAARLSPDLSMLGNAFVWDANRKKKRLMLVPAVKEHSPGTLKAWKAGVRATSKMIAMRSVLAALGLDAEELRGRVYDVRVRGKTLEVQF